MTLTDLPPICDPNKHQKADYVKLLSTPIFTCYICGMRQTGDSQWWDPGDEARVIGVSRGKDGSGK